MNQQDFILVDRGLSDLNPFILEEIANFFANYKVLQGIKVEVGGYHGKEEAIEIIEKCREAHRKAHS